MAEAVIAILGGVVGIAALIGFALSVWRKPPAKPGSRTDTGGLPPGVVS